MSAVGSGGLAPGQQQREQQDHQRDAAGDHHADAAEVVIVGDHARARHRDRDRPADIASTAALSKNCAPCAAGSGVVPESPSGVPSAIAMRAVPSDAPALARSLRQQQACRHQRGEAGLSGWPDFANAQETVAAVRQLRQLQHDRRDWRWPPRSAPPGAPRHRRCRCTGCRRSAPISITCLIGPVSSAACRMASTWAGRQESTPRADSSSKRRDGLPKLVSADPSAHTAVIATSSSPCFFSQALNKMIGAPATRMPKHGGDDFQAGAAGIWQRRPRGFGRSTCREACKVGINPAGRSCAAMVSGR